MINRVPVWQCERNFQRLLVRQSEHRRGFPRVERRNGRGGSLRVRRPSVLKGRRPSLFLQLLEFKVQGISKVKVIHTVVGGFLHYILSFLFFFFRQSGNFSWSLDYDKKLEVLKVSLLLHVSPLYKTSSADH